MISSKHVHMASKITGMLAQAFAIAVRELLNEPSDYGLDKHVSEIMSLFRVKGDMDGYLTAVYSKGKNEPASCVGRIVSDPRFGEAISGIYGTESGQSPNPYGFNISLDIIECTDINRLLYDLRKSTILMSLIIQTGNFRTEYYVTRLSDLN